MLYLEDYLEMIEHLPQELRDRFTEMRELDLSVQNRMDSLDKQQRTYYSKCKQGELPEEEIDSQSEVLLSEYYKVLEDADEKVSIATQIHELVDRYLRRLDTELFKFKCELEADNNGITEILEKRSLEMDTGSAATALIHVINNQKENRYYGSTVASNSHGLHGASGALAGSVSVPTTPSASSNKDGRYRTPKPEKRRDSLSTLPVLPEKRPSVGNTMAAGASPVPVVRPVTPSINSHAAVLNTTAAGVTTPTNAAAVAYNLQQLGGGAASNAIAAAASQAIVATQQMQQGRRTASLKASYEAIHGAGGGPTEFWISRDIANAASAAAQNSLGSEKKQKKKVNTSLTQSSTLAISTAGNTSALSLASSSSSVSLDSTDLLSTAGGVVNSVGGVVSAVPSSFSLASLSSGASTSTAAAANRANSASSSTSSSSLTPSSNLTLGENGLVVEQTTEGEWSYDPNEPRYCTCQQVSYGDMVACDNDACPYEWFHYPCVGITQTPKGKWYCPKCTVSMRRRGNRKN